MSIPRTLFITSEDFSKDDAEYYQCFVNNLKLVVTELNTFQLNLKKQGGSQLAGVFSAKLNDELEMFETRLHEHMTAELKKLIDQEQRSYANNYLDTGTFPSDMKFDMTNPKMRKNYFKTVAKRLPSINPSMEYVTSAIKVIEKRNKERWFEEFYYNELHWSDLPAIECKSEKHARVSIKIPDKIWKYLEVMATYINVSRQQLIRQLYKSNMLHKEQSSYAQRVVECFKMIFAYHAIKHNKIGSLPTSHNPFNLDVANNVLYEITPSHQRYSTCEQLGKYVYSLFPKIVRKPFAHRTKYREQRFLRIVGVLYNAPIPKFDNT